MRFAGILSIFVSALKNNFTPSLSFRGRTGKNSKAAGGAQTRNTDTDNKQLHGFGLVQVCLVTDSKINNK